MGGCLRGEVVRRVDIKGIRINWDTRLRKLLQVRAFCIEGVGISWKSERTKLHSEQKRAQFSTAIVQHSNHISTFCTMAIPLPSMRLIFPATPPISRQQGFPGQHWHICPVLLWLPVPDLGKTSMFLPHSLLRAELSYPRSHPR